MFFRKLNFAYLAAPRQKTAFCYLFKYNKTRTKSPSDRSNWIIEIYILKIRHTDLHTPKRTDRELSFWHTKMFVRFTKLYSWGISPNLIKVIPVTDWTSEWKTENTSTVHILNIEIFFITQSKFYSLYLDDIKKTKKNVCDWVTEGQTRS